MKLKLIAFCILLSQSLMAQSLKDRDIYFRTDAVAGNYLGGKIALEYISQRDYTYTLGTIIQGSIYKKLPSDYVSPNGILTIYNLLFDYPIEELTTYYFSFGKILRPHTDKIRFNLSGGLGLCSFRHPSDFRKITPTGTAENYSYTFRNDYSPAIILSPSIDFAVWKYFGFSIGANSVITKDRFSLGIGVGYMFGKVRTRKTMP